MMWKQIKKCLNLFIMRKRIPSPSFNQYIVQRKRHSKINIKILWFIIFIHITSLIFLGVSIIASENMKTTEYYNTITYMLLFIFSLPFIFASIKSSNETIMELDLKYSGYFTIEEMRKNLWKFLVCEKELFEEYTGNLVGDVFDVRLGIPIITGTPLQTVWIKVCAEFIENIQPKLNDKALSSGEFKRKFLYLKLKYGGNKYDEGTGN